MAKTTTVLIVDDDGVFRDLLQDILGLAGFEVSCCGDGPSALDLSRRKHLEVIITDYHMDDTNGADIVRKLRLQCPDSLIIGISGQRKERAFIEAGANAFLGKPFSPDELVSMIRTKLLL